MIYVGSSPLLATPEEIIYELKAQLEINGIELFKDIRRSGSNLQFTCPAHSNGQERKPSCGMLVVNKGEVKAGSVHCFACGYSVSLEEMISDCFGKKDFGAFGLQWLIKNFLSISVTERKLPPLNFARKPGQEANAIEYTRDSDLAAYRYTHDYMYARKLTDEVIEMFDVGYDSSFSLKNFTKPIECITFPVRDIQGRVLFVARRAIHQKFFHYPESANKPLYGVYEMPKDSNEIIICESIFNALTCWVYGKPALALLGTGTESQYELLKRLPQREIILALDPDRAGMRGTEKIKQALRGHKLVYNYALPRNKDINDLTEEEFKGLVKYF